MLEKETKKVIYDYTVFADNGEKTITAQTNIHGEFTFILPAGKWKIRAGSESITEDVNNGDKIILLEPFYVKAGTKILGIVKDNGTKESISNAKVEIAMYDSYILKQDNYNYEDFKKLVFIKDTNTDKNGKFSSTLSDGKYALAVTCEKYQTYIEIVDIDETFDEIFLNDILLKPAVSEGENDDNDDHHNDEDIVDSGECGKKGDNVAWTFYNDGELIISGEGEIKDYVAYDYGVSAGTNSSNLVGYTSAPWWKYNVKSITIKKGITAIGQYAFSLLKNLKHVYIPNTIVSFGSYSFGLTGFGLEKNESLTIEFEELSQLTTIGSLCFDNCVKLKNFTFEKLYNLTTIEYYAFNGTAITHLILNESINNIGKGAFWSCNYLKYIEYRIPNLKKCGRYIFTWAGRYSEKLEVVFTDSVINIPDSLFSGYSAVNISTYFANITSVKIGNNVKRIEPSAFAYCNNLSSIDIPSNVEEIANTAFFHCTNLEQIYVDNNNSYYCSIDGVLFSKDKTKLIYYPNMHGKNYKIPNGTTSIESYAFNYCDNLSYVTFPISLEKIEQYSFSSCNSITNIVLRENLNEIGSFAFNLCANLNFVKILNSECQILYENSPISNKKDKHIFDGIIYGYSNSTAQTYAEKNKNCTFIAIDKDIKEISTGSYKENSSYIFYDNNELVINGTGRIETDKTFPEEYKIQVSKIIVDEGIENIGYGAFYGFSNLVEIELPDTTTEIGQLAFGYCSALKNIIIPENVTIISQGAFLECSSLREINIPNHVKKIGKIAFCNCQKLKNVIISKNVEEIELCAFMGCDSLTKITIINPDCKIYDRDDTISSTATIYGYSGSTAEEYAIKYNRTFIAID